MDRIVLSHLRRRWKMVIALAMIVFLMPAQIPTLRTNAENAHGLLSQQTSPNEAGYTYTLYQTALNCTVRASVESILVGSSPEGITYDPANDRLYVANSGSSSVTVIDGATNKVEENITVGSYPRGVAYDPTENRIFVTNKDSGTVSVIDASSDEVIGDIHVSSSPGGIAYSPLNGNLYVADADSYPAGTLFYPGNVTVVNGGTISYVENISVGFSPEGVSYNPKTAEIFVSNYDSGTVSIINARTDQIVNTIPVAKGPWGLGYDPLSGAIYVTSFYEDWAGVLATDTGPVMNISLASPATSSTYADNSGAMYLADYFSNSVTIINGTNSEVLGTFAVGMGPLSGAYDSKNGELYFTNSRSDTVSAVDITTFCKTSPVPGQPPFNLSLWYVIPLAVLVAVAVCVPVFFNRVHRRKAGILTIGSVPSRARSIGSSLVS